MDHRDVAAMLPRRLVLCDDGRHVRFEVEYDDGAMVTWEVPARFEVCPTCEGRGHYVNPAIDSHGLSADDFAEDPDFAEAYFTGRYDVRCEGCGGERVVPVVDVERLSDAARAAVEELARQVDADHAYIAECEAERRMGA